MSYNYAGKTATSTNSEMKSVIYGVCVMHTAECSRKVKLSMVKHRLCSWLRRRTSVPVVTFHFRKMKHRGSCQPYTCISRVAALDLHRLLKSHRRLRDAQVKISVSHCQERKRIFFVSVENLLEQLVTRDQPTDKFILHLAGEDIVIQQAMTLPGEERVQESKHEQTIALADKECEGSWKKQSAMKVEEHGDEKNGETNVIISDDEADCKKTQNDTSEIREILKGETDAITKHPRRKEVQKKYKVQKDPQISFWKLKLYASLTLLLVTASAFLWCWLVVRRELDMPQ
ncbi:hypothetical protein E2C01_048595 [Portunus trituberculatus]|uniref:Uncharacterized protein n=1 Tax=Portunus trituberculatus TaxID=210409 RepID=A0A5B7G485_PORTR|nr:hypothetical protein [Portunus trituberculatus]